jgi:hypothetical protein
MARAGIAAYRARGVFVVGILLGLAIATALVIGWAVVKEALCG